MAKDSKRQNLQKLLRNSENILRNYVKVDDELLEAIAQQDLPLFNELAIAKSTDNFLEQILPEYPEFSEELFEITKQNFSNRIDNLHQEKLFRRQPERFAKPKPSTTRMQEPRKELAPKKNNRINWDKNEENRINILLKAGKKPKEIEESINKSRLENNKVQRTDSSIKNKIYRQKVNL